ncbi:hypothetical protein CsSME_00001862 [Camellia sinensis var. sinensis]
MNFRSRHINGCNMPSLPLFLSLCQNPTEAPFPLCCSSNMAATAGSPGISIRQPLSPYLQCPLQPQNHHPRRRSARARRCDKRPYSSIGERDLEKGLMTPPPPNQTQNPLGEPSPSPSPSSAPAPALVLSNSGKRIDQAGKTKYVKQVTGRHNDTELHLAAQRGDLAAVKQILGGIDLQMVGTLSGADFDSEVAEIQALVVTDVNELGETVLFTAADRGHLDVVKELLKYANKESISKKNRSGFDPLQLVNCFLWRVSVASHRPKTVHVALQAKWSGPPLLFAAGELLSTDWKDCLKNIVHDPRGLPFFSFFYYYYYYYILYSLHSYFPLTNRTHVLSYFSFLLISIYIFIIISFH